MLRRARNPCLRHPINKPVEREKREVERKKKNYHLSGRRKRRRRRKEKE